MAKTLTAAVRTLKRVDPGLSDRDLLDRHAAGDPDAFAALVRRHGKTVLAACRQVLTDPADLDDAFQATFVVLLKKAKTKAVAWQPNLGSWLYAVAHRLAVHARGTNARRSIREAEASRRKAAASPDLSWRDAVAVLHEELDKLPERYRRVLLLCYLDGQSRDEAAANLGIKPGAVKGCLERGRALLAARLRKRGVALSAGLLAVLAGSSKAATGGPSAALFDLTVRAAGGHTSSAVAALANGATPMALGTKKVLALVIAGLVTVGVGLGFRHPAATADDKPAQEMKKPTAKVDVKAEAKPSETKERTITGTVVGPDGKPLQADLTLHWTEGTVQPLGKTNPDGTFKVTGPFKKKELGGTLVATAAGCGPDFHYHGESYLPASLTPTAELAFKLPKERAIKGRVVNQEGRPVVGATVAAFSVAAYDSDASLDAHLKNWAKRADGNPLQGDRGMSYPKTARPPAATTDKDGRFELGGFGAGQVVQLKLSGDGIAVKGLACVNRDGFDPAPLIQAAIGNAGKGRKFNARWLLYGPDLAAVVEPEKLIQGRVTDHAGNPRAGARVQATRTTSTELTDHWYWHEATTDRDGRYEIRGVRKYPAYMVEVDGDPKGGQLPSHASAKDTVGYEPIRLDAQSARGVVVSGTVTDKTTGQPIRGSVRAAVIEKNPFVDQFPTFLHPGSSGDSSGWAGPDGTFRIVTIPGPVLLIARSGGKDDSEFKPPVPDPNHPHYFTESGGSLVFSSYRSGQDHLNGCWCKVLDAKSAGEEVTVKIELEPATKTPVKVVDADGKPVTGTSATGVRHTEFAHPTAFPDTDTLTVLNLEPKKERLLAAVHEKRKLVGTLTLTADTKDPVVKLGAGGTISGRAIGKDGKPLVGLTVTTRFTRREATEAFNALHKNEFPTTDANGEFRVDGLFPGQEFKLFYTRDKRRYGLEVDPTPVYTLAKPGDTRKVGEMVLLIDHE